MVGDKLYFIYDIAPIYSRVHIQPNTLYLCNASISIRLIYFWLDAINLRKKQMWINCPDVDILTLLVKLDPGFWPVSPLRLGGIRLHGRWQQQRGLAAIDREGRETPILHQPFSLPPDWSKASRTEALRTEPAAATEQAAAHFYRTSESRKPWLSPSPFFIHRIPPSPISPRGHPGAGLWVGSYPSPTTTHLMACIAGGVHGTDAGNVEDPTVCAPGSDESSGLVRLAMKPQWKRSTTNSADVLRKHPSALKGTVTKKDGWEIII